MELTQRAAALRLERIFVSSSTGSGLEYPDGTTCPVPELFYAAEFLIAG
jgi:hypothetical protein